MKKEFFDKLSLLGKKYRYPALILALGLVLLMVPSGKEARETAVVLESTGQSVSTENFDLELFTAQAEQLLAGLSGAGEVKLMLTLETDGLNTYLADETSHQNAESTELESQTVLVKQGSDEAPVSVTREFPVFRGAVVLCQGAQDPNVTLGIKEAISSLTGLGMDKITVLKMD